MKPLSEFYKNTAVPEGDLGIEVETEYPIMVKLPELLNWEVHRDGSLRNQGLEFTSKAPVKIGALKRGHLGTLCDFLKKTPPIQDCPRTSVHVHVNVLNLSPVQIWTAATAYWLLEDILFEYCGNNRKGSMYCLRMNDAAALLSFIDDDMQEDVPFISFQDQDMIRYSGLNLIAIRKFGSIEFRGMRGEYDYNTLDLWTDACYDITHKPGLLYESPEHMLDEYFKIPNKQDFLQKIFQPKFVDELLKIKNINERLEDGVFKVLPIGYDYDWKKWETRVEKVRSKGPKYFLNPRNARNNLVAMVDDVFFNPVHLNAPLRVQAHVLQPLIPEDEGELNVPNDLFV